MPVSYITHNNRKILHVDLKDIKSKPTVMENLEEMVRFYQETTEPIYLLLDVSGTYTDPEVMDKLKYYGKHVFKGKSKKRAVIGVGGVKKILLRGFSLVTGTEVAPFDDIEKAKEYLAN